MARACGSCARRGSGSRSACSRRRRASSSRAIAAHRSAGCRASRGRWRLPARRGRVALDALAAKLAREGCHEVLVEGGATLGAALLGAGLVQRLVLYTAPLVLGGGLAWCDGLDRSLASAPRGRIVSNA